MILNLANHLVLQVTGQRYKVSRMLCLKLFLIFLIYNQVFIILRLLYIFVQILRVQQYFFISYSWNVLDLIASKLDQTFETTSMPSGGPVHPLEKRYCH